MKRKRMKKNSKQFADMYIRVYILSFFFYSRSRWLACVSANTRVSCCIINLSRNLSMIQARKEHCGKFVEFFYLLQLWFNYWFMSWFYSIQKCSSFEQLFFDYFRWLDSGAISSSLERLPMVLLKWWSLELNFSFCFWLKHHFNNPLSDGPIQAS